MLQLCNGGAHGSLGVSLGPIHLWDGVADLEARRSVDGLSQYEHCQGAYRLPFESYIRESEGSVRLILVDEQILVEGTALHVNDAKRKMLLE